MTVQEMHHAVEQGLQKVLQAFFNLILSGLRLETELVVAGNICFLIQSEAQQKF